MLSFLTLLCILSAMMFPTFMICLFYPFNKRLALFWSNYITCRTARLLFACLKLYRKFDFIKYKDNVDKLPEQFVVISNHQSLFDIVVYLCFFGGLRTRFVAKDSLGTAPMVGKMLRTQGHCLIPRKGSPTVAMKKIDQFGERVMKNNLIPVVFPEGTRSRDGELRTFYAAGFRRLAQSTRLPVAVCALDGGWNISNINTIFKNLKRGAYRVKVLKIYDAPQNKEEELHILEEGKELIQNQLNEWRS